MLASTSPSASTASQSIAEAGLASSSSEAAIQPSASSRR